ncbi:acyl-CoA dehydrogenase [Arhodomonas sp. AD133]|uniref:acyl-CoA dehydrogenase n=1 Tax=Arhodomonas sp. AD133 TaxID=3415009 RepID=UPI003EBD2023
MYGLVATLIAIAAVWALAYRGVSLVVWTAMVAVYLLGLFATGGMGSSGLVIAAVIGIPVAAIVNLPRLRQRLVTGGLFRVFRKVLPSMSDTEREALEAGDTWWETDLFRGRPDWRKLHEMKVTELSDEEREFIDNQVETLCAMLDEDDIVRREHDLPQKAWDYLKNERFFSLIIPKAYGGREFSSLAQSTVVSKISSKSLSAAVTVMVPNSLGPGELLMKYGTDAQKDYWLPRLADGREIPCFALTGPDVGSDAGGMPDYGVVCRGEHNGEEVLGIRVNFSKRYITLAPVATVLGLAFKLHDPDRVLGGEQDIGITCALIPADHPGVKIGKRHFPMGLAFMNGPLEGEDVFIPLEWIIGGQPMAGKGWRMLVECLSVGRAISLPALATAASKVSYRTTGAYARIRRQFKLPIGKFEGVQEGMARIAGGTYTLEAARRLTASAGDMGIKPSVVSAIAKYHMTERMRVMVNDAMDIHAGRGIIYGPRNYLGYAYQAMPVAITVEGANILTRNLMIFGQGAIRCHPYVLAEMEAAQNKDLDAFDRLLVRHVGYSINRGTRALTLGLTGARLAGSPVAGPLARYYRQLTRMSTALAFVSDVAMGVLGGDLKRRERLSARLGDVLSQLYLASAVLKFHADGGRDADELDHVRWALEHALAEIYRAFDEFFDNFPNRAIARGLRIVVFPLGRPYKAPEDRLGSRIAERMMAPGGVRDRVTAHTYLGASADDAIGRMEATFELLMKAEKPYGVFQKAVSRGEVDGYTFDEQLANAVAGGVIDEADAKLVADYEKARYDAIVTDAFDKAELTPRSELEARRRDVA